MESFEVTVSFGKQSLAVEVTPSSTVQDVAKAIETKTGVFVRLQKLIFKGKVLDLKSTLATLKIGPKAKIMLLATGPQGASVAQAAPAPQKKPAPSTSLASKYKRPDPPAPSQPVGSMADRAKAWQKTGIIALRDLHLTDLPPEATQAPAARVLDASGNALPALPPALPHLTALQALRLSSNQISATPADAPLLAPLQNLTTLVLDSNVLTTLHPICQPGLSRLQVLSVGKNRVEEVPAGIRHLQSLRVLSLPANHVARLPEELGECTSLREVDLASNRLQELPQSLSGLVALRTLRLISNSIVKLPDGLLGGCTSLVAIALGNNPISLEGLRNTPGFTEYDQRRRDKCDKQLEMAVMMDFETAFQEGADVEMWERYR